MPKNDYLLEFDGSDFGYSDDGRFFARFAVQSVEKTQHRPHGYRYCLILCDTECQTSNQYPSQRVFGIDNFSGAHTPIGLPWDHVHRLKQKIKPYTFTTPEALISDFFKCCDEVINELDSQNE